MRCPARRPFFCHSTALRRRALRPQLKRDPLGRAQCPTLGLLVRSHYWWTTSICLSAAAIPSCRDSSAPSLSACTSDSVTITASSGLTPTFSWTPNCRTDQVWVQAVLPPSAGSGMQWIIAAKTAGKGVAAPIRYGDVPIDMEEVLPTTPLQSGATYRVFVAGGGAEIGQAEFKP